MYVYRPWGYCCFKLIKRMIRQHFSPTHSKLKYEHGTRYKTSPRNLKGMCVTDFLNLVYIFVTSNSKPAPQFIILLFSFSGHQMYFKNPFFGQLNSSFVRAWDFIGKLISLMCMTLLCTRLSFLKYLDEKYICCFVILGNYLRRYAIRKIVMCLCLEMTMMCTMLNRFSINFAISQNCGCKPVYVQLYIYQLF